MLLGFLSLLLTVGTKYVAKICVPEKVGYKMLPCKLKDYHDKKKGGDGDDDGDDQHRKLLSFSKEIIFRRVLAGATDSGTTCSEGMVPMISYSAVHQLHIFIFILAVFHVLYSVVIIGLGLAKMKKWKAWEAETSSLEYEFTNDPARFRFAHQTSFVKRHTGLSTKPGVRWVVAFFRQFFGSISKVDYLTIRNGFINVSPIITTLPYLSHFTYIYKRVILRPCVIVNKNNAPNMGHYAPRVSLVILWAL
ncbi:hypothetical protein Hanom_Chr15g01414901 [Helianthus anomalus]